MRSNGILTNSFFALVGFFSTIYSVFYTLLKVAIFAIVGLLLFNSYEKIKENNWSVSVGTGQMVNDFLKQIEKK